MSEPYTGARAPDGWIVQKSQEGWTEDAWTMDRTGIFGAERFAEMHAEAVRAGGWLARVRPVWIGPVPVVETGEISSEQAYEKWRDAGEGRHVPLARSTFLAGWDAALASRIADSREPLAILVARLARRRQRLQEQADEHEFEERSRYQARADELATVLEQLADIGPVPVVVSSEPEAWAKAVAGKAVQSLADSEPDGPCAEAQDLLQGTDAESYFVVSAATLESIITCVVWDELVDNPPALSTPAVAGAADTVKQAEDAIDELRPVAGPSADTRRLDALQEWVTRGGKGAGLVEIWSDIDCRVWAGAADGPYTDVRECIDAMSGQSETGAT